MNLTSRESADSSCLSLVLIIFFVAEEEAKKWAEEETKEETDDEPDLPGVPGRLSPVIGADCCFCGRGGGQEVGQGGVQEIGQGGRSSRRIGHQGGKGEDHRGDRGEGQGGGEEEEDASRQTSSVRSLRGPLAPTPAFCCRPYRWQRALGVRSVSPLSVEITVPPCVAASAMRLFSAAASSR